ncbi:MAG: hypothetical protein EBR28_13840, partial [Planctomycetia bacterium]|nr:hypothetical protein [Planctomycetia bacterium]
GTLTNDTVAYDAQAGTVSAALAGAAGLSKTTSGTLTLSGSSTYTGMTTLSAGQLNVNSASAIGTGTFTISGGAVDNTSGSAVTLSTNNAQAWNSDFAFVGSSALNLGTGAVTLGADRTVTVTSSTLTVGGVVGGAFALTKAGAGTLSLAGANTYAGTTRITAGSLSIGNALALQNTTLDLNGADAGTVSAISQNSTLGGLTGSRNLDMLTRTLSIGNNNASTTYSGTLSNGALTKIGSGTLTLSGSNSYTGATTINAGVLALSSAGNLASTGTVAIAGSGATFDISGANGNRTIGMLTGTAGSTLTLGANSLTFGDATSGTFAGSIGGTGGLTKQGAGTLVLSGSNSFGGGLTLTGGQIQIANANALGTGTFTTNVDADTTIPFNLPTSGTIANNITINKPGSNRTYYFQQNQSSNLTLAGNITVASGNVNRFTLNGVSTGTVTLTGSNSFGSDVSTSAGMTFRFGGTNAAGSTVWRPDGTTNFVLLDGASFRTTIGSDRLVRHGDVGDGLGNRGCKLFRLWYYGNQHACRCAAYILRGGPRRRDVQQDGRRNVGRD